MRPLLVLLAAAPLAAQSVKVYSEFTRTGPFGEVVAADRGAPPREILSPGIARNAYASFHVVVRGPAGLSYTLDIGQNPEEATRMRLYKEVYEQVGETWIPDRLDPVSTPYQGVLGGDPRIPRQTAQAFWLDLWVDGAAPVRRVRIEPQMWAAGMWHVYPMEVRVLPPIVPYHVPTPGLPAPLAAPSDASAAGPLRALLCARPETAAPRSANIRAFIRRNALQDAAFARQSPDARARILALTGPEWCGQPQPRPPEWYLRLRDALYQRVGPASAGAGLQPR